MSTLHVKESYAGAIEKLVGNPCPVHESRPGYRLIQIKAYYILLIVLKYSVI